MSQLPSVEDVDLSRRNRLIVYYALSLAVVVLLYAALYNYGMRTLEGRDHSFFRSFQTVVETMTTTGYGADSPWETPIMNLFVVFMQLTGIAIGFFTLRVLIIPLFTGAEVNLDDRLSPKSDHVVVCEYRRESAVLLDELSELGIDYVLVDSQREDAKRLSDAGYSAIHGSPQESEALERASLDDARAVITDAGDANVETILTVREGWPDVELIALTDDGSRADLLRSAGADTVLSPRATLGRRLAEKAAGSFTHELRDAAALGEDVELTEIPVPRDSPLDGVRIRQSGIREQTGANVVGAWIDGELQLPPDPDAIIHPNTVLLVTGAHEELEELGTFARAPERSLGAPDRPDRAVIAGLGEVGSAARSVLEERGIDASTIDVVDRPDVGVVGDATERATLEAAGLEDAGAVLVCLPEDPPALLTTVQARAMSDDVEVLVRVSDTDATGKALRGGADYVLSVPRVSARLVARELRGEDVLAPASQVRAIRVSAAPFAGQSLAESGIYEQTGCRVIAVADDGRLTTEFDPTRPLNGDERLTVVGTDETVQAFLKRYDVAPEESAAGPN